MPKTVTAIIGTGSFEPLVMPVREPGFPPDDASIIARPDSVRTGGFQKNDNPLVSNGDNVH
ncbi:hypothetical protein [Rhizobium sp. Leaf321]|uniref:hypothetical protein n=1 Tax=Rhizobium sp. Leaf321 TaxID=1736335 RepID=UPI0012E332CC|nr:hypothetical protein [Rhizobium sp. Leaf321]